MSEELPPESADSQAGEPAHDDAGLDLARSIARGLAGAARRASPMRRGIGRTWTGRPARSSGEPAYSGAHPDARDPQTLDESLSSFIASAGWETELRVHGVFARWAAIVGDEVAQHARPQSFADGRLSVVTDSTAWATQMRLLAADVVRRLNEVLGDGTVTVIDVRGPHAPSWSRGRFRVKGRGPRDTYG